MKYKLFIAIAFLSLLCNGVMAQEQPKQKSPEEIAYETASRMEKDLNLESHQTFHVDSTLQHDMRAWFDEIELLQKSGKQDYTVYKQVQDKWTKKIEESYKKIFTEEQWNAYLKSLGRLKKDKKDKKAKKQK